MSALALRTWLAMLAVAFATQALAAPPGDPVLPAKEWQAIRKVVEDQLAALKAGDGATAMTFTTPGIRAQFGSPENFLRMVRTRYAPLLAARYTQFLEGAVLDRATIQPLRLVLPDETVLVALYQMQRGPNGQWRVAGCVIAPSNVRST